MKNVLINTYIDVPDEVFGIFEEHRKAEQAYRSKKWSVRPSLASRSQ
jgi:hypothetical protein